MAAYQHEPGKTFTALYFDGDPKVKAFYVKRFSFVLSDNTPTSFISDGKASYLVDLSEDLHPRFEVSFKGKNEGREPEIFEAEEFIAKKGLTAKGKRCHSLDVKSVRFVEPLHKPEDDIDPDAAEEAEPQNLAGEIDMNDIIDVDLPEVDLPEGDGPDDRFAHLQDPEEIEELTLF